ncbi:MAG: hypothetical protein ACREM2_08680 [Vulcanimicrobiaceae bacterium]
MSTPRVARWIALGTVLAALAAGSLAWVAYEPAVAAATDRVRNDALALRSNEIAFAEVPHLRAERSELARRYAPLFSENAQAVFLRELAADASRRHVAVLATQLAASNATPNATHALLAPTGFDLELGGTYRDLLAAIEDLSLGSEIVTVGMPTLHRDGNSLAASVPVTLDEPLREPNGRSP